MSEVTQEIDNEVDQEVVETNFTDVEQEALNHGWKPKEEYEGDPSQWRSAETFMALKPFFERIDEQNKKLKRYERAQQEIMKDVANMRKTEYDRALRTLQAERKAAFDDGDLDRYHRLDDEIDEIKDQRRQIEVVQDTPQDVPDKSEFIEWKTKNTWYERDEALREWADSRGVSMAHSGMAPRDVLEQLEREVREKFPERFTNPNRSRPSSVAAGDGQSRSSKPTMTLTPEENKIMQTFVRQGIMTEEQYLKEYKKVKGN